MVIAEAYADVAEVADGGYAAAEDVEEGVGLECLAASAAEGAVEDAVDASEAASAEEQEEFDGAFDGAAGLGASVVAFAVASAATYVAAAVVAVAYVAEVVAFADSGKEVAPCDFVDVVGVASDAVDDVDPASGVGAEVADIELEEVQTCGIQPEEEHGLEQGGDVQHVDLLERVGAVAEEAASLGALEAAAYAVDGWVADAYAEA